MTAQILPSILSADFARLAEEVDRMAEAGAEIIHVDVMDGHFVPNLTVGLPVVAALRRHTSLLLDVHLMISNPDTMAERFVEAGADFVSVHYESTWHLDRVLEGIREKGAQPGVAVNPHSPVHLLEEILRKCHHVLVMSVNPGFGGQKFISSSFQKVRKLNSLIKAGSLDVKVEIDGGLGPHNVEEAIRSGVDWVVTGSAIFHSQDPVGTFRNMKQIADSTARRRKNGVLTT